MSARKSYRRFEQGTALVVPLGTAADPSIILGDDNMHGGLNDGIYGTSTPSVDIAIAGAEVFKVDGTATAIAGNLTVAGTATVTGAVTFTATISRSQLATESKFYDLEDRLLGADGAALAAAETAGDFFRQIGTNQLYIEGEATINETEVSVGWLSFVLPEAYVSGGTITLRAVVDVVVAGDAVLNASSTVDFEARLQTDATGAVGADLVTTAATAITATGGAKDFVVTPTGLVAGDKLVIKLSTSVVEDAGGTGAAAALITKLGAVIQVKG